MTDDRDGSTPSDATGADANAPHGTPATHDVLGTPVRMPVEIRHARCFVAGFTADSEAVMRAINSGTIETGAIETTMAPTRLRPLRIRPGRTMCMLVFVEYLDGDLGPYNEFGVCFLVEDPAEPATSPLGAVRSLLTGEARALVHHLPVDGEFTLAAGRGIWGFPKTLADFTVDHDSRSRHGIVSADGELIADLRIRPGFPVPDSRRDTVLQAYSRLDGTLRMTPWRLTSTSGTRTRMGGASLTLGTSHPIATELRSLGLGRRALMTSSVDRITMTFEEPTVLT